MTVNTLIAVAEYFDVDIEEVIDNEDGLTVIVGDTEYMVVDLPHGITEYNFMIVPLT